MHFQRHSDGNVTAIARLDTIMAAPADGNTKNESNTSTDLVQSLRAAIDSAEHVVPLTLSKYDPAPQSREGAI